MILDEKFWSDVKENRAVYIPPGNYFEIEDGSPLVDLNNKSTEANVFVTFKDGRFLILVEDVPRSDRLSEENVGDPE